LRLVGRARALCVSSDFGFETPRQLLFDFALSREGVVDSSATNEIRAGPLQLVELLLGVILLAIPHQAGVPRAVRLADVAAMRQRLQTTQGLELAHRVTIDVLNIGHYERRWAHTGSQQRHALK